MLWLQALPLSPDLLGSNLTGTGIGFMKMTGYMFAAFGETILGFAIDITGSTNSIFIIISILCILSSISVWAVRFVKKG